MATTPPQSSNTPATQQATPLKCFSNRVANTTNQVERDARMAQVGLEMGSRYVGPIELKVFLDTYLPQKGPKGKPTKIVGLTKKLKTDLEKVSKLKNEIPITCGRQLVLIDTHADADNVAWAHQSDLIKPDILLKPRKKVGMRRNDITHAEFFWEFKWRERDDGFDDGASEVTPPFEKERKDSGDTRNQMATYAGAILCSQFRTHLFSIQVTRTRARLLCWDREGAVVTSSFVFAEELYLVEFIKQFAKASREDHGHDPCVTKVEDLDLQTKVCEALEDYSQYKISNFTFPNEQANEKPVTFYGGKIVFEGNACPTGRSTRGFLVVNEECKNKAYLKDTWRITKPGMQKEGDIYKVLKENNVQKIPGVVACGDAAGKWQQTVTGLFSEKDDTARRPYQHYFIVLDTIGRRLTEFKMLGELLNAIKDAFQGEFPFPPFLLVFN
ncbi:hypothetical protein L218DRAFT_1034554 [Marasmius fiardii PR-910]|nr:hypothetical protein L218DRAFT_1034554 [Marasmius fiardii PR-910]